MVAINVFNLIPSANQNNMLISTDIARVKTNVDNDNGFWNSNISKETSTLLIQKPFLCYDQIDRTK